MTSPGSFTFTAAEGARDIANALADLEAELAEGTRLKWGRRSVWWDEAHECWAYFGRMKANTRLGWRYWNAFGTHPRAFRRNMLVEINPPQQGLPKGTQGLIARDRHGARWLLHAGGLHPKDTRIPADQFASITGRQSRGVRFSDSSIRPYFIVAPLDGAPDDLRAGLAAFIDDCEFARTTVMSGKEDLSSERRVRDGEGSATPEKGGNYVIPARPPVVGRRIHADVWKALTTALNRARIKHTNARVGRYGPDLRTRAAPLVLFEIKTDTTARSIYEALGQLILYERLLADPYIKVVVLPGLPPTALGKILTDLDIRVLTYHPHGKSYRLDTGTLRQQFNIGS